MGDRCSGTFSNKHSTEKPHHCGDRLLIQVERCKSFGLHDRFSGDQVIESQYILTVWHSQSTYNYNRPQFLGEKLKWLCEEYKTNNRFSSVHHPHTNGQVKASNKIFVKGLKKRVQTLKRNWVEEWDSVLWAIRTPPKTPTTETPFSFVNGTEVVVAAEIVVSTHRILHFDLE